MKIWQQMLINAARRPQQRFLSVLEGLTPEQANGLPARKCAPTLKSIAWLAWHTAREQDLQIAGLAGTEPLWTAQGWNRRFALDLPDDTEDWRHTPEEAAKVVIHDLDLLRAYLDAATQATIHYLEQVQPETLEEVIDRNWTPPVTRAVRLVSIIDDASMHSGQAVYVRRLLGVAD